MGQLDLAYGVGDFAQDFSSRGIFHEAVRKVTLCLLHVELIDNPLLSGLAKRTNSCKMIRCEFPRFSLVKSFLPTATLTLPFAVLHGTVCYRCTAW
jgi:hypothetical protein